MGEPFQFSDNALASMCLADIRHEFKNDRLIITQESQNDHLIQAAELDVPEGTLFIQRNGPVTFGFENIFHHGGAHWLNRATIQQIDRDVLSCSEARLQMVDRSTLIQGDAYSHLTVGANFTGNQVFQGDGHNSITIADGKNISGNYFYMGPALHEGDLSESPLRDIYYEAKPRDLAFRFEGEGKETLVLTEADGENRFINAGRLCVFENGSNLSIPVEALRDRAKIDGEAAGNIPLWNAMHKSHHAVGEFWAPVDRQVRDFFAPPENGFIPGGGLPQPTALSRRR